VPPSDRQRRVRRIKDGLMRLAYDLLGDDDDVAEVFGMVRSSVVNFRRRKSIPSTRVQGQHRSDETDHPAL